MLWHGAQAGAFDLRTAVLEAMTAFRRAGETKSWQNLDFFLSCSADVSTNALKISNVW